MILHRIELHHVGRFRETVVLGPFAPGLNILCAPNESGKTTALRAAARALFDRHTTKDREVKSLQPAGTELAPRVAVEFETAAGRYRIEKTFLHSPDSRLLEWQNAGWQLLADGERADTRLQELLHSTLPGRGATKPEHWGFLGFLWAQQGQPADWPELGDEGTGRQIRHRLAKVELDPVMERVCARLSDEAGKNLTATGQPKTGGILAQAEEELRGLDEELARIREQARQAEALHQRHREATAEAARLEKEHADLEQKASFLLEQARTAERVKAECEGLNVDLENRRAKLASVAAEERRWIERQAALVEAQAVSERARSENQRTEATLTAVREALSEGQDHIGKAEAARDAHRSALQHLRARMDLREAQSLTTALESQRTNVQRAASEVDRLNQRLTEIPSLTLPSLSRLEKRSEEVRTLQAQVQALGLSVELTPSQTASVRVMNAGSTQEEQAKAGVPLVLRSPQALDLHLEGWGRVMVRSGSREAGDLLREQDTQQASLAKALLDAGVPTLEAAREAVAARRQIETEAKAASAALAACLGDHASETALRTAWQESARRVETLAGALDLAPAEQAVSRVELQSLLATTEVALQADEARLKALSREIDSLQKRERATVDARQTAQRETEDLRARQVTLESQIADVKTRYPQGMEASRDKAGQAFVEAEARVKVALAMLPADHEKLPERNRRAAVSRQEVANALQSRRSERDAARGSLEALGAQGLYSRETEILERRTEVETRRNATRTRAWAARAGQSLIEFRRQNATQSALAPLEQNLSATFAELTGHTGRRVFLDEQLRIAGIGPTREASHAFDVLSQGAREQLLLCLRIAVAKELAQTERQTLWLDDVLVNTDGVRQERILDLLATLAGQVQIVLLTCHPERYRGVGCALDMRSGA